MLLLVSRFLSRCYIGDDRLGIRSQSNGRDDDDDGDGDATSSRRRRRRQRRQRRRGLAAAAGPKRRSTGREREVGRLTVQAALKSRANRGLVRVNRRTAWHPSFRPLRTPLRHQPSTFNPPAIPSRSVGSHSLSLSFSFCLACLRSLSVFLPLSCNPRSHRAALTPSPFSSPPLTRRKIGRG